MQTYTYNIDIEIYREMSKEMLKDTERYTDTQRCRERYRDIVGYKRIWRHIYIYI